MTRLNEKINKLINRLVRISIEMGYSVQESDHLDFHRDEIYELLRQKRLTETQIIEKFIETT